MYFFFQLALFIHLGIVQKHNLSDDFVVLVWQLLTVYSAFELSSQLFCTEIFLIWLYLYLHVSAFHRESNSQKLTQCQDLMQQHKWTVSLLSLIIFQPTLFTYAEVSTNVSANVFKDVIVTNTTCSHDDTTPKVPFNCNVIYSSFILWCFLMFIFLYLPFFKCIDMRLKE